jgi:hypothetical protein
LVSKYEVQIIDLEAKHAALKVVIGELATECAELTETVEESPPPICDLGLLPPLTPEPDAAAAADAAPTKADVAAEAEAPAGARNPEPLECAVAEAEAPEAPRTEAALEEARKACIADGAATLATPPSAKRRIHIYIYIYNIK